MAESLKTVAVAVAEDWGRQMAEKFKPGAVSLSNLADLYSEPHVAMLLAGLAVENLAKGLVIRREGLDRGELPKGLDKHETLAYLDRGKFKLTADERRLVKRLEGYVVWAGRYPVPKRRRFSMGRGAGMTHSEKQFLKLYERLRKELL
jgi:hypothetical protein